MSLRQPVVSGERLVKALRKEGWDVVRQRGSHVAREEIALDSDLLERGRRRIVLAREVAGLAKDAAAAALWLVVAVVLIAALKGSEGYPALTILCVLAGGSGIGILRGRSGG